MSVKVKICGVRTPAIVEEAADAGADFVGLVLFAKSPRHIDWATARTLGRQARGHAKIVALSVDADDDTLKRIVEAHNGTIGVENIPGRGAEFVVRLPISK